MIKIFLTVRNRLAITKKCIHALKAHSVLPHQIYVYNNDTNHLLDRHFSYFYKMYEQGVIDQISFTKDATTFNAFSKAATCNLFGLQHEQDPNKDKIGFLVFLDNDIIVTPKWDKTLLKAWTYVYQKNMNNIKVIGQLPGGIKYKSKEPYEVSEGLVGHVGKLGGSGLWSVRTNFFTDVGTLDLKLLVGQAKGHDQKYWTKLEQKTRGQGYIMGLKTKLGIHCGRDAGSVCNNLTRHRNKSTKNDVIKFAHNEEKIDNIPFDEFYEKIKNDSFLANDW